MMRLVIILIIANIGLSQAQYTLIPDPHFEQLLINEGIDLNLTLDGQVLTSSINTRTNLEIINNDVIDLTGIQDFSSLEILEIALTQCTNIDLGNLSNLYELACVYNQNLTSIDTSQCVNLENLQINNNNLMTIDVLQNILLRSINVLNNALTTINLEANKNLKNLLIVNNHIESLDLTNNNNLIFLNCDNNELISLDLTHNNNITRFRCNNNQLENLNFRNNNNQNIEIFETFNNPNLTCIYVDNEDYSTTNWLDIDPNSTFVETEAECTALAINDFSLNSISVYPNPTKDILFIENPNIINIEFIKVYNMLGQQVLVEKENFNQINLSTLKPALYLIAIKTQNGVTNTKIIKQ